jgi:hypothetical protein
LFDHRSSRIIRVGITLPKIAEESQEEERRFAEAGERRKIRLANRYGQ